MFEAFWRALAHLPHPRVLVWTLLPLLLLGAAIGMAGWLGWEAAQDGVRAALLQFDLSNSALQWLDSMGANRLRVMLAPIVVVALAVPVVVVSTLLLVGWTMAPVIVQIVARRRFPQLERLHGTRWWQVLAWPLVCAVAALVALAASLPLWLVPPLALLLPPLIWGWLSCRVLAFAALADHASAEERRHLIRRHRWPLLAMGLVSGFLATAPALVWTLGEAALIFGPFFLIASVWLYTLVFAFAALWFAHYALAQLARFRAAGAVQAAGAAGLGATSASTSPAPPVPMAPTMPTVPIAPPAAAAPALQACGPDGKPQ